MKYGLKLAFIFLLIGGAFKAAQNKVNRPVDLNAIKLGSSVEEIEKHFGTASSESHNQRVYILNDGSELLITLRDQKVSSATVKFHKVIKIEDPEMRKLTLVQMQTTNIEENPTWFFAGKPDQGLIYKISSKGIIESLTWILPFSDESQRPKHLGALLRDFKTQRRL